MVGSAPMSFGYGHPTGSDMMSQIRNFAVAAMRSTPQAVLAGSDEFRTGTDLWAARLDIAVIGAQKAE